MTWARGLSPGEFEFELAPLVPGTCRRRRGGGAEQSASAIRQYLVSYWTPPAGRAWVHDESSEEWRVAPVAKAAAIFNSGGSETRAAAPIEADDPPKSKEAAAARKREGAAGVHRHKVLRTDTFQGICLKYKVTPAVLRRANKMLGNNLMLAPETIVIPMNERNRNVDAGPSSSEMMEDEKTAFSRCQVAGVTKNELSWKEAGAYRFRMVSKQLKRAASDVYN